MKKKLVSLLMAAAMASTMIVAPAAAEEKITLTMYSWWADAEQAMGDALIAAYEESHPNVDIEVTYVAEAEYLSKINTLVAAESLPDVYYLNEYLVNDWGNAGISADLKPLFDEIGVNANDTWVDTALYTSGDSIYGINYGSTTILMYYNKQMFEEAGITPPSTDATQPWTWEEYVDAATKLTKDMNGLTPADEGFDYDSCMQFGTTMTNAWIYWLPMLYAGGTSVADDAGEALAISSPEAKATLQAIADLAAVQQCAPSVGVTDSVFSDTSAMLMNGQLGMFIGGNFLAGNFTKENYDVGVAQIPLPPVETATPSNMVWSAAFAMNAKSEHPQEAAEFLAYMADFNNSVQCAANGTAALNTLPNTKSTLDTTTEQYKLWTENYSATIAEVSSGILANASRTGENVTLKNFSIIMNEKLVPALDGVWLGEVTADEAISAIEADLAAELQGAW